jgi:hypothetical protein
MELFRGTMLRHSAIVYPNDHDGDNQPFRFDDDHWPDFTPIRLPTTICSEDHTPAGAAAMLVNQAHGDPDLVLPIDAAEKRLFDSIDGQRSITEILRRTAGADYGSQDRKQARVFFLFIRRDTSGADVRIPEWFQVQDLGQMKKTMPEVIVVLLAVLFLIVGLENQYDKELNWNLVPIPVGILGIAGAIKLIDLNH